MCWFKEQTRELYINFVSPRTRSLHLTSLNVFREETGDITSKDPDLSVGVKFSGFSYGFQHFDLYPAHIAIEQWGFFSVPYLLWHGASVYNGRLRGPVTNTFCRAFSSGAVTTCLYDLGLSWLGFEHPTFRLLGERSSPVRHRRNPLSFCICCSTSRINH